MRRIEGPTPGEAVPFVPTSFGNDREPEPVTVYLRVPTVDARRRRMLEFLATAKLEIRGDGKIAKVTRPDVSTTMSMAELLSIQEKMVRAWVDHVDNYLDADGTAIASAEDLWLRGEPDLVAEVYAQVESMLALDTSVAPSSPPLRAVR
jgi:hypothetical protein